MTREIILDTETTGLNPFEGHKIIEIAAIELIDQIRTEKRFHCFINPERDIPEASQKIHNISYEMVKEKPIFKDVIVEFLNFIKNDSLIIHNADFDLRFLNYELSLCGRSNLQNNIIDTLSVARSKYPGSSVSLDSLCRKFDININERKEKGHGALIDCYLLSEVYLELKGGKQTNLNLNKERKSLLIKNEKKENKDFFRKKELKPILNDNILKNHIEFVKKINCDDIWGDSHKKLILKINKNG